MASRSTPQYFKSYYKNARKAAAKTQLDAPYFRTRERSDKDLVRTTNWRSQNLSLSMPDVHGEWSLYLSYDFQTLPGSQEVELVKSSYGLDFVGTKLKGTCPITVVRFDYDRLLDVNEGGSPGNGKDPSVAVHMNVHQQSPLESTLHFPAFRSQPWQPGEVMGWLTSQRLQHDLKRCLPT